MATKRKGGLKLNAICAKLSRQVVVEKGAGGGSQPQGSPLRPQDRDLGAARGPRSEEDKRRAVIEKWVNGEYSEEPAPTPLLGRLSREGPELPPEGVYMVQPQGCSDEEDQGHEPARGTAEKDPDSSASKGDGGGPGAKQASGGCRGERWGKPSPQQSRQGGADWAGMVVGTEEEAGLPPGRGLTRQLSGAEVPHLLCLHGTQVGARPPPPRKEL